MKRLRLKSPAQIDYTDAVAWYEAQRQGLGREFETEVEETLGRIRRHPEHFSKATATVRKARLPRFKYSIYFTVDGDEIGVLAISRRGRNGTVAGQSGHGKAGC